MHEVGAVNAAAAGWIAQLAGRPAASVTVGLGPGVDLDVADSTWRSAVRGRSAATARVIFKRQTDLLSCLGCAAEYPGSKLDRCPSCGGDGLVVEAAPEVVVLDWLPAEHQ